MKITPLVILLFLSMFVCCKRQPEKSDKKIKIELDQSIDAFNDRPIYEVLTNEIIDSIADDNLILAIYDNLYKKCPDDHSKEYATVMSWNKSRRAIFIIWWLEAEVNNGGFNQYYLNSSGQYYKELPTALRDIGAIKFSNLVQKANNIYEQKKEKTTTSQDDSLEGFIESYNNNPLDYCDNDFFDLYKEENLTALLISFIRKNKSDFIDK